MKRLFKFTIVGVHQDVGRLDKRMLGIAGIVPQDVIDVDLHPLLRKEDMTVLLRVVVDALNQVPLLHLNHDVQSSKILIRTRKKSRTEKFRGRGGTRPLQNR